MQKRKKRKTIKNGWKRSQESTERKKRASKYRGLRVGLQPHNIIDSNLNNDANLTNLLSACKCSAEA